MSREYTISAGGITVLGATTLILLRPGAVYPATVSLEIIRMWIGESSVAVSQQQRVEWGLVTATFPTPFPTVTGDTPRLLKETDPVSKIVSGTAGAAGTCGVNASVESGSLTQIGADAFNNVGGWNWIATPDETIVLAAASPSAFYLRFPVAPLTLTDWAFGLTFREIG